MLDIDKMQVDINCPKCDFINEVLLEQVRLQDIIICRGCKRNIQLIDSYNTFRKTKKRIEKKISKLKSILKF